MINNQNQNPSRVVAIAAAIVALSVGISTLSIFKEGSGPNPIIYIVISSLVPVIIIVLLIKRLSGVAPQVTGQLLNLQRLKTDTSLQHMIITDNPKRRERILKALEEIQTIRRIKPIDDNNIEIEVMFADKSRHSFRAVMQEEDGMKKLIELNRFS